MKQINSMTAFGERLRAYIERADASNTDADFNELALSLFALQFAGVPIYRQLCSARGISPQSIQHWTQIPAMPTSAFKELELTSLSPEVRTRVFHSSGTTAQKPSRHFHSAESIGVYEASLRPWFRRHFPAALKEAVPVSGVREEDSEVLGVTTGRPGQQGCCPLRQAGMPDATMACQALILTPPPALAPHSSLVHMFETVSADFSSVWFFGGTAEDGSWTLDIWETVASLRKAIQDRAPVAILGTAFSFVTLLDALGEKQRLALPNGSRVFETGGYKGRSRELSKPDLHRYITRMLGVPASHIVSEYGMSELSSQAYDGIVGESSQSRVFHFPPWARAQILSPETGKEVSDGETGLVRIFDLANVWSVMAIQTEDLAIRRGTGFELAGRASQAEPRGCSLMIQ